MVDTAEYREVTSSTLGFFEREKNRTYSNEKRKKIKSIESVIGEWVGLNCSNKCFVYITKISYSTKSTRRMLSVKKRDLRIHRAREK